MDSFDIDNVKVEKANAMKKYQRLQKIANFFRFFEICLVLILFSWCSTRLPSVFRIFEKYFRQLCVVVISPWFVFLIGNVIVLTLFAKSGKFSDQDSVSDNAETELYEEFVKKSEKNRMEATVVTVTEDIVYEDKQTVYEEKKYTVVSDTYPVTVKVDAVPVKIELDEPMKIYRRSKSVSSKREIIGKSKRELRRSETEIRRKSDVTGERGQVQVEGESYSEAMSNEEFQRTIEAFIAKQVRFHQEESKAIVLQ